MQRFEAKVGPGSLIAGVAGSALGGLVIGAIVAWLVDRFTPLLPSQAVLPGLAVGGLAFVGMVVSTLKSPKVVQLTDQSLRLIPYVGAPVEYDLQQHAFSAHLTYNRGSVVARAVTIRGADGKLQQVTIGISPAEFDRLMNLLTGVHGGQAVATQGHAGQGHPGQGYAPPTQAAPFGAPLAFEPVTFTNKRTAPMMSAWTLIIMGLIVGGLLTAVWISDTTESIPLIVGLVLFALFAGLGAWLLVRTKRIPRSIVVAPTWVSFDGRGFQYHELFALQLKAPGLRHNLDVKLMRMDRSRVDIPLSYGRANFDQYDQFAELLHTAANAVKKTAAFSFSG